MSNRPSDFHRTVRNAREATLRGLIEQRETVIGQWFWSIQRNAVGPNDLVIGIVIVADETGVTLQCAGRKRRLRWPGFQKEWRLWQRPPQRPVVLDGALIWISKEQ